MGGGSIVLYITGLPGPFFSLLFSDHFVSPVTDSFLFLNKLKREKIREKMCSTQVLSWVCLQMTQLQCLMGCHGHHAILCNPNKFVFG